MELFSGINNTNRPLADAMRPETLDDFVGQEHIIGKGRLLRRAIQADQLSSLIFYGPPGTGKTTLARIIANTTSSYFITINAVLSGVKEIRDAIDEAKKRRDYYGKRTILFVDEVHRWNKAQQDALLPWVENGTFIFIGATTENPYFEVNSALVSRSRVFQLLSLTKEDLIKAAENAIRDKNRGYGRYDIEFEPGALEHLAAIANGDARSMLNALQLAVETTPASFPPAEGEKITITLEIAEESIQKKALLYDKEGDYHYDTISAFIKSLRGSDPDAALYWMARMIAGGEDPKFLFRRMMILASEDVGLAEPGALGVVVSAAEAFDRVGMPEGQFFLSQAALYLALCRKSNSTMGYFDALAAVKSEKQSEVPNHLKDPSRDKESFGHGEGYKYPHAFRDHWVAQQYLPAALKGKVFYTPGNLGYEKDGAENLARRREAQLEAQLDTEAAGEVLTFSPEDKGRDAWFRRTAGEKNMVLSALRDEIFSSVTIQRHHRILIPGNDKGLLAWEGARLAPEGGVTVLVDRPEDTGYFINYPSVLPEIERPEALFSDPVSLSRGDNLYDIIIGRNIFTKEDKSALFNALYSLMDKDGKGVFAQIVPCYSTRLSDIVGNRLSEEELSGLVCCEKKIYSGADNLLMNWNEETLSRMARQCGFEVRCRLRSFTEKRFITERDAENWFDVSRKDSYGSGLKEMPLLAEKVRNLILLNREEGISWKSVWAVIELRKGQDLD